MSLEGYIQAFRSLNVNRRDGHASPHKVCMLLAVMDLIESDQISDNRILFNGKLLEKYHEHFAQLQVGSDQPNPHLPFYHLKTASFWHHQIKSDKQAEYDDLSKSTTQARIREAIEYAYLDNELIELLQYSTTRELLKYELFQNVDVPLQEEMRGGQEGWSRLECELVVSDYINMLLKEMDKQPFVKAQHRADLKKYLDRRTDGSIEYKYQNISAILIELGLPYIRGYKPAFNYQKLLQDVVVSQVTGRIQQVENGADIITNEAPEHHLTKDWRSVLEDAPVIEKTTDAANAREFMPRIYDYASREERNRKLGKHGEGFVIEFERERLKGMRRPDLAKKIEWTSCERGDGAGYDVRSFRNQDGDDLFIEVKTTNSGKYQPFYISDNEVAFSEEHAEQYSLYRVFEFRDQPRIYQLTGSIRENVILSASQYQARFR